MNQDSKYGAACPAPAKEMEGEDVTDRRRTVNSNMSNGPPKKPKPLPKQTFSVEEALEIQRICERLCGGNSGK